MSINRKKLLTNDQHSVAIRTELIFLLHGHIVGLHDSVIAAKSSHHHEHCAQRHMEIGDKRVADGEIIGGEYEFVGPSLESHKMTIHANSTRHCTEHGSAYGADI